MNAEILLQIKQYFEPQLFAKILDDYLNTEVFDKEFLQVEKLQAYFSTRNVEELKKVAQELGVQGIQAKLDQQTKYTEEIINNLKTAELNKFLESKSSTTQQKNEFFFPLSSLVKVYYEQGNYKQAQQYLKIVTPVLDENTDSNLALWWGKLNIEILTQNSQAKQTLAFIAQKLEDDKKQINRNSHILLQQRATFLHYCLFLHIKQGKGPQDVQKFIEYATTDKMLAAIQIICPYFIKYLIMALIQCPFQSYADFDMKKLGKLLKQNQNKYSDCWTDYINQISSEFDFVKSRQTIQLLATDSNNDIFVKDQAKELLEQAKYMFFERYCRLYTSVTVQNVAEFLGSNVEDAEIWIVNLIRNANIEAKIDSDQGVIAINKNTQNFNEKISLKLRDLIPRTNLLCKNLLQNARQ